MSSDQEIIAEVNERARAYANAAGEQSLPDGYRCNMDRHRSVREHWERAAEEYKNETGIDVLDALARHEADLRSPVNAPQLHIERR